MNTHRASSRPTRSLAVSMSLLVGSLALAAVMTARRGAVQVEPRGWSIAFRVPADFRPAEASPAGGRDALSFTLEGGGRRATQVRIERRTAGLTAAEAAIEVCREQLSFMDRLMAVFNPVAAPVGRFEGVEVQFLPAIAVRAFEHDGDVYTFVIRFGDDPRAAYRRFESLLATVVPLRAAVHDGR